MHRPRLSFRHLLGLATAGAALCGSVPAVHAQGNDLKRKSCGQVTAGKAKLRVELHSYTNKKASFTCATARGVQRAYALTRPTQERHSKTLRYKGLKWDCYFIRDSSGYNCSLANDTTGQPTVNSRIL